MAQPVPQYDEYEEHDGDFELLGEQRDEAPARSRGRLVAVALTLGVMLLFAGGLWFAYVQGMRHAGGGAQTAEAVPLLRADDRPTKVSQQPGGMPMPDQNSSLYNEKLAKSPVEKLLPPPEQPLPRPAPAPMTPVRPTLAPQIQMPPPEASPAETAASAAGPRGRVPQTAPAATPPAEAGPGAAPQPVQKAALPAEPTAGTVQVRLGSLRTPEEAREEWQRLKRANADLLGNLRANAVSVDLGEKGIHYRILAGPLDEAAAERLCTELKRRSQGCIIAR